MGCASAGTSGARRLIEIRLRWNVRIPELRLSAGLSVIRLLPVHAAVSTVSTRYALCGLNLYFSDRRKLLSHTTLQYCMYALWYSLVSGVFSVVPVVRHRPTGFATGPPHVATYP